MQEILKNCRCCLKSPASDYFNGFVEFNRNVDHSQKIVDLFESLTSIKVDFTDLENSKICGDCLEKLKSSNGFRNMCLNSNKQILEANFKREPAASNFMEFVPVKLELKSEIIEEENYEVPEDDDTEVNQPQKHIKSEPEDKSRAKRANARNQKKPKNAKKLDSTITRNTSNKKKTVQIKQEENDTESDLTEDEKPLRKKATKTKVKNSYTCSYCAKIFKTKHLCNTHEKIVHIREMKYTCHHCDQKFVLKSHVMSHLFNHFNIKNYSCELCAKSFTTKQGVKTHKNFVHKMAEKTFGCSHCDMMFITKETLKNHLKVHTNDRPFKCDFEDCGKTFRGKCALKQHEKIHQPETFDCEICGMKFKRPSTYRVHMRLHEFQAANVVFSCDKCPKSFKLNSILKLHKKSEHSDFKQYGCSYCEMRFPLRHRLTAHIYSRHISNTFECELCPQTFKLKKQFQKVYLTHIENQHTELNAEEFENLKTKIKGLKFADLATDFPSNLLAPEVCKECPQCHLRFANSQQLEKHLEFKCTKT